MEKFLLDKSFLLTTVMILMGIFWFSNNLYAAESTKDNSLVLTKDVVIKKEYKNKIIYLEAVVINAYSNKKNGIKSIYLKTNLPKQIQVTIWPSLGITDNYIAGDKISIIGTVKGYRGKLQITPLSKKSIRKLQTTGDCSDHIGPEEIQNNLNQNVVIKGMYGVSAKEYTSKKNQKKHLLFTLKGKGYIYKGIMFDGSWSTKDLDLLSSEKELCVYAKVSKYKGAISLQAQRFEEVEK